MYEGRYKITETFEYNKENGPFENIVDRNSEINSLLSDCGIETDFFGYKTKLPLGVAAGPLYNKRYMIAAAKDGFSAITWKTFRSVDRLAHRNNDEFLGHNIVYIADNEILPENIGGEIEGNLRCDTDMENVSITNSFGMPSQDPLIWKKEVEEIEVYMQENNKLPLTSVVGTPQTDGDIESLALDYAFTASCAEEAGSKIIEINLSCPNVSGKEGSIYKDKNSVKIISEAVRKSFKNSDTKLLIKIGYADKAHYVDIIKSSQDYIDGIVAINTIPMQVLDKNGKQALPGGRLSGVCGHAILKPSLDAVSELKKAKIETGSSVKVISCGGVTSPDGFMQHISAGSEFVMCATSALFNPTLPYDVALFLNKNQVKMKI